jgi:hypothetical protein
MNRLLLALLALFAGLVTLSTPAQARLLSGSTAQIGTAADCRNVRPSPSPTAEPETPVLRQAKRERDAVRPKPLRPRVFIPSVLFGPDRAFE